ncbi:hypothetical protein KCP69_19570 [Salmonella enterica subsp. enterica]|nr:hypothetical protein KCP69_19570 [Salmonella enterica subsp. enterica]
MYLSLTKRKVRQIVSPGRDLGGCVEEMTGHAESAPAYRDCRTVKSHPACTGDMWASAPAKLMTEVCSGAEYLPRDPPPNVWDFKGRMQARCRSKSGYKRPVWSIP